MGRSTFVKRLRQRAARSGWQRYSPSSFSYVLAGLALLYWLYFLLTRSQLGQCSFASDWAAGWFSYGSPLQLFGLSFGAAFLLWVARLFTPGREYETAEATFQGIFIVGFLISVGFVKAMVFPYALPSFDQAQSVADYIFPFEHRFLYEEISISTEGIPTEWPYNFPPPPRYPNLREWIEGYDREPKQIFRSWQSPSAYEIDEMVRCSERFRARLADRQRAILAYGEWHKKYGWRVEPQYLHYRAPLNREQKEEAN